MGSNLPDGRRGAAGARALEWLTTRVLVAYLAVAAMQWLWTLLNTDVRSLLRPLP
jgi:hypothetical protein